MGFFAVRVNADGKPEYAGGTPELGLVRPFPSDETPRPSFRMTSHFGYTHAPKQARNLLIVVPTSFDASDTDLASLPTWLGWIAAKTGLNLPAAVLHDVLVVKTDRDGNLEKKNGQVLTPVNHWYRYERDDAFTPATRPYEPVDRWRADWIFRDAMGDLGVDRLRRWLMWAGVALGTLWTTRPRGLRGLLEGTRVALLVSLLLLATAVPPYTLFHLGGWLWDIPPLGDRSTVTQLVGASGLVAALAVIALIVASIGSVGTHKHRWVLGLLVVPVAFLGWALAVSLFVVGVFGLMRRIAREPWRRRYVGVVTNYYRKVGVAAVSIREGTLRVGDSIEITRGERTFRSTIESMELNNNPVFAAVAGQEVGIKVPWRVREGYRVFAFESPGRQRRFERLRSGTPDQLPI